MNIRGLFLSDGSACATINRHALDLQTLDEENAKDHQAAVHRRPHTNTRGQRTIQSGIGLS